MVATQANVDYLHDRWTRLPGDDGSASFLLEDLLLSQDRLADAEFSFAQSQYTSMLARVQLKQALGILLNLDSLPTDSTAPLPVVDEPPAVHAATKNIMQRLPRVR
jgi:hypothetical protein